VAANEFISEAGMNDNCLRPVTGTLLHPYNIQKTTTIQKIFLILKKFIIERQKYAKKPIYQKTTIKKQQNQICLVL